MSEAHSTASKNRWAKVNPKTRSKRMSKLVSKRWALKTPKQRSEYASMMAQKRLERMRASKNS